MWNRNVGLDVEEKNPEEENKTGQEKAREDRRANRRIFCFRIFILAVKKALKLCRHAVNPAVCVRG